ncbi:MAG TPA: GAF domain-containing protein [Candidatus Sericytochromatia bacterium]|jgi:PAS domain S-box-containing protein
MSDNPNGIPADRDRPKEELIEELEALRQEVAELRTTKAAFDAQNELIKTFVIMLQTATGKLMLRSMLQQTMDVTRKLTDAEESSLFLLDADGVVTESLLARGATLRAQKQRLLGQVLDKGLAGWVIRHRQVGLIIDTRNDERWLTLPNQPYSVRSALCVPIQKGKELLGVLTLMHSQPGHFNPETVQIMQMTATQMALILENARLYTERQQVEKEVPQTEELASKEGEFSLLGIYILFGEGNFLYANSRLAEIFGYTFGELVSLESVLDLVATDNRRFFAQQMNQCLQGYSKNLSCKFRGQRKDGSRIDVEVYGTRTKLYGKFVIVGALRKI